MNSYKENKASYEQVRDLLNMCDFVPPLEAYVNIDEYVEKIINLAYRIECWSNDKLVGVVAMYCNDYESKKCFITSVGVRNDSVGRGIATKMLKMAIEYGNKLNFKCIELEVHSVNTHAIKTYKKLGFQIERHIEEKVRMSIMLDDVE